MNGRTLLALVLVVTLLLPGIAAAAVYGNPDLSTHLPENRVTPGEDTTLDVVVANSGELESGSASNTNLNSEVTQARGVTVELGDGGHPLAIQTAERAIGSIADGATAEVTYDVAIEEDAEPGTYTLPVTSEYTYTSWISEGGDGNRDVETTTEDTEVTIRIVDRARFEIVDVEHEAQIGDDGDLRVTVRNVGSEAGVDATATITAQNDATTFGDSDTASRYLGNWSAGENRTLSATLSTAENGDPVEYDFDVSVGFEDSDGIDREDAGHTFGISPAPEQSFALANPAGDLAVGEDGTLEVDLENTADAPVENVVLRWEGTHETISATESEWAMGTLEPGETDTAAFDVEVSESARSGPRQFSFVATYTNTDGDQRTSDELTVRQTVGPEADAFDLSVENATITAGGGGELEVTVTNADDERVSDVSAKLFADSPISTTDDEAFVAGLDPGETTTLVFGVGAGGGAIEKSYPVSLDFRYDEADGDTALSDSYRLPVEVVEPEGGGGLPIVPILVVVVVLAAAGGYYRYRQ